MSVRMRFRARTTAGSWYIYDQHKQDWLKVGSLPQKLKHLQGRNYTESAIFENREDARDAARILNDIQDLAKRLSEQAAEKKA